MPTYEYKCNDCGVELDIVQNITENPITVCPKCQGDLKKLFSPGAGFIFKGSGFYITDYRSEEYKKREKAEKGEPKVKTKEKKKEVKEVASPHPK
ncbi:MAG: zinc ribbon domain-containing protein [bacterium]|nr:zinc ribbon domain-containing protein [bacterium]